MRQSIFLLLLLLPMVPASAQRNDRAASLDELVRAERAFARTSVEKGMREAFLAYFADSGINFQPHPVHTRGAYLAQPQEEGRSPITLNWEPVYADMAESGDLGYTTGPFVITDHGPRKLPPSHGYYFSIWRRQANGEWKVMLDNGVTTPPPPAGEAPALAMAPPGVLPKKEGESENRRRIPHKLETGLLQAARMNGFTKVFSEMTSEQVRLYRNGMAPVLGRDSMMAYLSGINLETSWAPLAWDMASTWDLCYAYGTYELRRKGEIRFREHGYYVRIWKRQADGKWRIVLDAAHAVAPEEKLKE